MAGARREAHILKRFTRISHPRTAPHMPMPERHELVTEDFDYPRILMDNESSSNEVYHHQAMRSAIADVIFRSTNGPTSLPPERLTYSTKWAAENKLIDLLPAAPSLDDFGSSVMLIPVMRHRVKNDQDTIVLLLLLTQKNMLLLNPFEHRTKRSLKHLLESDEITKVVLNSASEIHFYWVLLQAACKKMFCLTSLLETITKLKKQNFKELYNIDNNDSPMAKFNVYYDMHGWKPVILQTGQSSIGASGARKAVKGKDLQMYARLCVDLLSHFDNEDKNLKTSLNWGLCMQPLGPYLTAEPLFKRSFWMLVAKGLDSQKNMHSLVPLIINVCFRLNSGNMDQVKEKELLHMYKLLEDARAKGVVGKPSKLTAKGCENSADAVPAFIQCMLMPAGERKKRSNFCCTPGCFNDVLHRISRIAPAFFNEFRQGF